MLGEERVLLVGIADGAGSAARSEEGSRLVVETVLLEAGRHSGPLTEIDREHAERWLEAARHRLERQVEEQGGELGDYASTVLLAILGEERSVFVQLGDGGWVVEADRGHEAATWPTTGEYANQTIFLTSPAGIEQMQFVTFDQPLRSVAGFTDGVQSLCLDLTARCPHGPFFDRMLAPLRSCDDETSLRAPLEDLLGSTLFNSRTDDDKTLVVACHVSAEEPSTTDSPTPNEPG